MKSNVETLLPDELRPNMILAEDLVIDNVKLLIEGVELTQKMIDKIISLQSFIEVKVYMALKKGHLDVQSTEINNKECFKYSNLSETKRVQVQKLEKSLDDFTEDMKSVLKCISLDKKIDVDDVRKYSKIIIDEFGEYDYDILIKSILLDKSVDEYLYRHSINVSILSSMIGRWMGIQGRELLLLTYSGLLHDIGKTLIDPKILNKPSALTKNEFEEIKKHTEYAYKIIKKARFLDPSVGMGVLMHHERIDGSGYPFGIKGEKIHKFAKIIAVADEFDAMTSNKVYSKRKSPFLCLEELQSGAWNKLDGDVCAAFLKNLIIVYTGENVRLNNGKVGKIVKLDMFNISKPLINVDEEFIDLKTRRDLYIDELL
ncbi:HD-GYP domain-containing protein [Oceanirhabdus sp. W0125-5]|uniref:HD-GYP domain-containing protein n=1 Tax=Oceanirhabdus sp. W0125-5 TaxID=2999116 RepID=UPI0022F3043D|nr:HD-GYP domain-containing protein [Oceanirhabdus sp. W0125-5]WBW95502.1 HD-GYP domain-containing protein [Oceanirhabdus sp. W0125-5]